MALPSGPLHMNRTDELYARLRESSDGEARLVLDQFDFVFAPVAVGKSRKVYGPAEITVMRSETVIMHVTFTGNEPPIPPIYSGEGQ